MAPSNRRSPQRPAARRPASARSGRGRTPAPQRRNGAVVAAVVAVVVLVALVVAVVATRGGGDDTPEGVEQTRPVEVDGAPLAAFPESGSDPAVGRTAPALRGRSFDGSPVEVRPGDAPTLVLFLAHWCPHCRAEVPKVVEWLESGGAPQGMEVVAVSTGVDSDLPNYPPSSWLEKERWPRPTLADDRNGTAASAYGLRAYPFFVALAADGTVVERAVGELDRADLDRLARAVTR